MLDENLPSFHIKPSADNELNSTVFQSAQGSDLRPEYMIRRPDPRTPAAKNCYALALYDPFNPDVLYGEVLVNPEWAQPTLSAAEMRALNGAPAAPTPVVPNSFAIQLYNPDQQITVKRGEKTWGTSSSWEFLLPQSTFRVPSASALDRSQDDPAISDITPKVVFRWKRDNKFTKDISCYMSGKSTDTKKTKEPDITVAMFRGGKTVTIYQPNLHRVDVEDMKGLEVVLLLGAQVIKDLYITPSRDTFNLSSQSIGRKNSMNLIGRNNSGGIAGSPTGAQRKNSNPVVPASQNLPASNRPRGPSNTNSRPPPTDPRTQWQIDAEAEALTAALQAEEERERKAREKQVKEDERQIKKMLEAEEKIRKRKEDEDAKETERLRKLYGVSVTIPALPPRPQSQMFYPPPNQSVHSFSNPPGGPQMSPYGSAPHSRPNPSQRPLSTPSFAPPTTQSAQQANGGIFGCPKINEFLHSTAVLGGPSGPTSNSRPHRGTSASGPYLQPSSGSGANLASVSSFFHGGQRAASEGRRNIQKKRSVFF